MEPNTESSRILICPPQSIPKELVVQYLERCRSGLPLLKAAASQRRHEEARVLGHRMKGTGTPYGFPKLTEFGAEVERAAAAEDDQALHRQVVALEEYLSRVDIADE